jgi:hypothetical protein
VADQVMNTAKVVKALHDIATELQTLDAALGAAPSQRDFEFVRNFCRERGVETVLIIVCGELHDLGRTDAAQIVYNAMVKVGK